MTAEEHPHTWSLALIVFVIFWPTSTPIDRLIALLQALPGLTAKPSTPLAELQTSDLTQ